MPDSESVYTSKIDGWIGAPICGVFAFGLYLAVRAIVAGSLGVAALIVSILAVIAAVMFPTRYTITSAELVVQAGLLRTRIPLAAIRRVYPHRSLIASPALSLDRLAIEYQASRFKRPTVWISPSRTERFVTELAELAGLERHGSELTRREHGRTTEPDDSAGPGSR